MIMFQDFLKTITEIPPGNIVSIWNSFFSFLPKLSEVPEFFPIIQNIGYSRAKNCCRCGVFLDPDNDDGVCETCDDDDDGLFSDGEFRGTSPPKYPPKWY